MKKIYITLRISALMLLALLMIKYNSLCTGRSYCRIQLFRKHQKNVRFVRHLKADYYLMLQPQHCIPSKTLEFILQHRFGYIDTENDNEISLESGELQTSVLD